MPPNSFLTATTQPIILCVADDVDYLYFITTAVRQANPTLQIATAYNGNEALKYLEGAKRTLRFPSLIILDINLPQRNGMGTLIRIKSDPVLSDIPVVMSTTTNSTADMTFCRHYEVSVITKPTQYEAIIATVKEMLSVLET